MTVYQGGEKLSSSLYTLLRTGGILNGSSNRFQRCRVYFPDQIGGRFKRNIYWQSGKNWEKMENFFHFFICVKRELI